MKRFTQGPINQIPTNADDVYAFRVTGAIDDDTSKALSDFMNDVFDRADNDVHMLFDLSGHEGRESPAILNMDVLRSRLRAVANVGRYAVVGAPVAAEQMIEAMDKIIPVDARTFDADEIEEAWSFLGARPLST